MEAATKLTQEEIMEARRKLGHDRWDEMWDGVLHMAPNPTGEHQELTAELWEYLKNHWAKPTGNKAYIGRNIASPGGWPRNYRIPDVVLMRAERMPADKNKFIEGAPTVAIEITSPDDDSYLKLDFYLKLGVPETWIIDRDRMVIDIFRCVDGEDVVQTPSGDGWFASVEAGVEMRFDANGKLAIRVVDKPDTQASIPE